MSAPDIVQEQARAARFIREAILKVKRDVLRGNYGPIDVQTRREAERFVREEEARQQREGAR